MNRVARSEIFTALDLCYHVFGDAVLASGDCLSDVARDSLALAFVQVFHNSDDSIPTAR